MKAVPKKRGRKKVRYEAPKMDFAGVNLDAKDYTNRFYSALHFAQYEMTNKALAKAVLTYAKDADMTKADMAALKVLDDKILEVLGKYATILNGGGQLKPEVMEGFEKLLSQRVATGKAIIAAKKAEAKKDEKIKKRVVSVQDRIRDQAADLSATFDGWLDHLAASTRNKADEFDPLAEMQKASFKAPQARYVSGFYEAELAELQAVLAGKDADLKEGYANLKKTQIQRMVKLIENILAAANMVSIAQKAKRAPRKKKAVSQEKLVARIKYKEQDTDYGIASVNPINIIGAREVWVFNTRNRKLGRYVAQDDGGLTVKGAYIKEFNEGESVQKSLRKPKEQLAEVMKAGKVQLRKFLGNIKAMETSLNGKMNEHIVILRVVK